MRLLADTPPEGGTTNLPRPATAVRRYGWYVVPASAGRTVSRLEWWQFIPYLNAIVFEADVWKAG